jgi:hypothetical protein
MIHASQPKSAAPEGAGPAGGLLPVAPSSSTDPAAPGGMLSAPLEAASAPALDPNTGAAPVAQPAIDPNVAAASAPTTVAAVTPAPTVVPAAGVAVQAPAIVDTKALDGVTSRMQALEQRMDSLENSRQAQIAAAAAAPAADAAPVRKPRKVAAAKPAKKAEPKEEILEPATLVGLQLRAVHPSFGPDMQAWVLEGDQVRVVNRGSMVAGARVLEVRSSSVVTDRGVIR